MSKKEVKPAVYKEVQAWINFQNQDGSKDERKIRVAMPDGQIAYISSLCSTYGKDGESVFSVVIEETVRVKEYVEYSK